jgi:hypothetical protein
VALGIGPVRLLKGMGRLYPGPRGGGHPAAPHDRDAEAGVWRLITAVNGAICRAAKIISWRTASAWRSHLVPSTRPSGPTPLIRQELKDLVPAERSHSAVCQQADKSRRRFGPADGHDIYAAGSVSRAVHQHFMKPESKGASWQLSKTSTNRPLLLPTCRSEPTERRENGTGIGHSGTPSRSGEHSP